MEDDEMTVLFCLFNRCFGGWFGGFSVCSHNIRLPLAEQLLWLLRSEDRHLGHLISWPVPVLR